MSSQSLLSRLVTTVSANVLRAVGSLVIVLSVGVAAASVSTDYALGGDPTGGTAAYTVDVGAVTALVEFAVRGDQSTQDFLARSVRCCGSVVHPRFELVRQSVDALAPHLRYVLLGVLKLIPASVGRGRPRLVAGGPGRL